MYFRMNRLKFIGIGNIFKIVIYAFVRRAIMNAIGVSCDVMMFRLSVAFY